MFFKIKTMKSQRLLSMLVLAVSFIFFGSECRAQDEVKSKAVSYGFGYYRYISGSGHGTGNVPVFLVEKGKSRFMLGPNFQNTHSHLSGAYAGYEYTMTVGDQGEELFINGIAVYHQSAYLSRRFVENEQYADHLYRIKQEGLEDLRFRTVEYYFGFGLREEVEENLKIFASINVGGYRTLWQSNPQTKLFLRSPSDISLMLETGITYQL